MLSLNLRPIFSARAIEKPYTFLVKNGFSYHTASHLLNSTTRSFRLDHIELLCEILVCEPNDLLLYTPNKGKSIAPDNPLNKLLLDPTPKTDLNSTLQNLPYQQLKELSSKMKSDIDNAL